MSLTGGLVARAGAVRLACSLLKSRKFEKLSARKGRLDGNLVCSYQCGGRTCNGRALRIVRNMDRVLRGTHMQCRWTFVFLLPSRQGLKRSMNDTCR